MKIDTIECPHCGSYCCANLFTAWEGVVCSCCRQEFAAKLEVKVITGIITPKEDT